MDMSKGALISDDFLLPRNGSLHNTRLLTLISIFKSASRQWSGQRC